MSTFLLRTLLHSTSLHILVFYISTFLHFYVSTFLHLLQRTATTPNQRNGASHPLHSLVNGLLSTMMVMVVIVVSMGVMGVMWEEKKKKTFLHFYISAFLHFYILHFCISTHIYIHLHISISRATDF